METTPDPKPVARAGSLRKYLALLAVSGLLWLLACTPQPPLIVALHPWVGYEPLYLARDFKWLPPAVRLRESSSLGDSLQALQSGEADAACMTLDEMLRARAAGLPLSAALVLDVSAGADKVLAHPEIKKPGDLANRRIGFDHSALGALVFEKLLETAGLPASAVIPVDLPPDRQLDAWRKHEVDAVITYDPLATAFLREGARNLFDSRQIPDTIIDVLAVRRDRPKIFPLLQALAASHFRALEHMRSNEADTLFRISAREGLEPDEVRRMLASVTLPSLAANRAYLDGGEQRLLKAAKSLSALMAHRGLLAQEDDLAELTITGALPNEER